MAVRTKRPNALALTLALACLTCTLHMCRGQTANQVNETSGDIIWGELASDAPYKTADAEDRSDPLDPYYALAVSFIDSSLPELLPVATAKGIIEGTSSIGDEWQGIASSFVGYALCVVIGLLFIFIFPIVALCFCCCRLCGNCGGKRVHHQGPNDNCKRIGFSIALAILSLFVIAGGACTFVTSDQISNNMDGLTNSMGDAADDLNTFFDNIHNQFSRLGDTNFDFLTVTVSNYVGNASSEVSERITSEIKDLVNMGPTLKTIEDLNAESLVKVNELSTQLDTLETQRVAAKATVDSEAASCSCLAAEATRLVGLGATITSMKTELDTFKTQAATNVFSEIQTDIDTAIKIEVDKATGSIDVTTQLGDIQTSNIQPILDEIDTMKQTVNSDITKYKNDMDNVLNTVDPYDQYRWYSGVALACFLILIPVLFLLGIVLGMCGSRASDKPTQRGSASNCGGILLMAGAGLIFIFAALLMIPTTIIYAVGAPVERYFCQSIDNLDRLETYTDEFDIGIRLSNISVTINGQLVSTSVSTIMNGCENGKTLFDVFGLKPVIDDALDAVASYRSELDKISDSIHLGDTATAIQNNMVDVSSAIAQLKGTVTTISNIQTSIATAKTQLETDQSTFSTQTGSGAAYQPMIDTLGQMQTTSAELKTKADGIETAAIALDTTIIPDAIAKLGDASVMSTIINDTTYAFVNNIFGYVQSYINDLGTKLYTDVGRCTPFYSIINAILSEALCHGAVDPLNGFWLAMGWCLFFFMPSLILAVKLAKHFRTALYDEGGGFIESVEASAPPYYTGSSAMPIVTPQEVVVFYIEERKSPDELQQNISQEGIAPSMEERSPPLQLERSHLQEEGITPSAENKSPSYEPQRGDSQGGTALSTENWNSPYELRRNDSQRKVVLSADKRDSAHELNKRQSKEKQASRGEEIEHPYERAERNSEEDMDENPLNEQQQNISSEELVSQQSNSSDELDPKQSNSSVELYPKQGNSSDELGPKQSNSFIAADQIKTPREQQSTSSKKVELGSSVDLITSSEEQQSDDSSGEELLSSAVDEIDISNEQQLNERTAQEMEENSAFELKDSLIWHKAD